MSIYLAETAVTNVAATIRSYLPAELLAIDAAKADGNTLEVIEATDVFEYSSEEHALPRYAAYEIFCEKTTFGAENPEGWTAADVGSGRLNGLHEVTVRISVRDNRGDIRKLRQRVERHAAALLRVLAVERYTLGDTVQLLTPLEIVYRNDEADKEVRQAVCKFKVWTYEVNA